MNKNENRSVRRTKKLLYNNLAVLLKEKPINNITVKELTDLCDLNRGTFYLYYKDIFDMVNCIEKEIIEDFDNTFKNIVMNQPYHLLEALFMYIQENGTMTMALLSDNGDISFYHQIIETAKKYCFDIWKQLFKIKDSQVYEYYFTYISSGFLSICKMWYQANMPQSPQEMASLVEKMMLCEVLKN